MEYLLLVSQQNLIHEKYQTYAINYINYMVLNSPNNHVYFCTNYKYHSHLAPASLVNHENQQNNNYVRLCLEFCEIQWKKEKYKTNYNSDNYLSIWQQLCTSTHIHMNCNSNERLGIKIIQFKTTNLSSS